MGIASAVSGGLGVGMGLYQTINGAKEKREAPEAFGLIDIDFKEQSISEFLVAVGF